MEVNGGANQLIPRDRRPAALGDLRVLPDEVVCAILSFLSLRDVARLSCVSSVMYIFCNEEPLWMSLCLNNLSCHLEYKGSWKRTLLHQENVINVDEEPQKKPLHFDGFYSLFLYKRLYRCYTTLDGFYVDDGNVERKKDLSLEEFSHEYDGKKPVLLNGLADSWPARNTWTIDQLVLNYGDTAFRISQRSSRKIRMQLKDYVSYMNLQHDEDPLYIFDEKFGEVAPGLLKDYNVPHLFREDFFDVLDMDQRPPFRWLIIGPERSGASWHVDPALTSAWNTLLCGRKRWALYPPGKVPLGVTVHVNEEDGDVNIDTPTSMQWWLEFYPLLPDEDKPIECTQMPGETIFVPSGWWHCVLNLELTIAVTQNFVNFKNFEYVCLDMAPGYRQKGVCRAGLLALDSGSIQDMKDVVCSNSNHLTSSELPRIGKRLKMQNPGEDPMDKNAMCCEVWNHEFPYDIHFLSKFLDKEIDHYNSAWSSGNCIGQRDLRAWLWKLWVGKPGMRDLIWKGACLALSAGKWVECVGQICKFHGLCSPADAEKMPVGTGSNPVYLVSDIVIKIYVEEGLENSLYCLGTELEFYDMLCNAKSPLKEHVPKILASGLIFLDNGSYRIVPWDGRVLPDIIDKYGLTEELMDYSFPFGVWSKKLFEYRKAQTSFHEPISSATSTTVWPYIVTERCKGKIFAELRESISSRDALNLASFLGEQLRNLHCLPLPSLENSAFSRIIQKMDGLDGINVMEVDADSPGYAAEWEIFIRNLAIKRKDVLNRLTKWGDPIPKRLIEKVSEYLPSDLGELHYVFKGKTCSWIHSDIMDDNIHMEPSVKSDLVDGHMGTGTINGTLSPREGTSWKTSHVLDFSDLSIGDLILDLIPIHLDIFRGDAKLLKQLLASYLLPVVEKVPEHCLAHKDTKFMRPSYRAMCYCILHEENVLGAIFSLWEELRMANSWDGVESHVWGILNEYTGLL